jgi:hypothetical protein
MKDYYGIMDAFNRLPESGRKEGTTSTSVSPTLAISTPYCPKMRAGDIQPIPN